MSKKHEMKDAFKAAFPVTIPVLTGFMVLGIAYGILMEAHGYGPFWSFLFSLCCYCGSMQYATIPFLVGEFQPLYVLLLAVMVNARHLFYGISMLGKYGGTGKFKTFLIYYMSDETFAINSSSEIPEGIRKDYFYFATTLLDLCYWVSASVIGGIIGSLITFDTAGLDFALTALFVVLFLEQLKSKRNAACGVIGVAAGVISLAIFGSSNLIIPAMIIILIALIGGKKKLCN